MTSCSGRFIAALLLTVSCLGLCIRHSEADSVSRSNPSLLHVEEVRWGMDNTVQMQDFNLLSVKIHNVSASVWNGRFLLTHTLVGQEPFGISLKLDVSLGPEETRWIQLTPFVNDELDDWRLDWGGGEFGQLELRTPVAGPRPTVLIYNPDAVLPPAGPLRRLPAELFPQSLPSTGGLRGIILHEVPFWTGARARTFREWLQGGGRVYLLKNDSGNYPQFPGSMAILNQESNEYSVGAGVVKRLPYTLSSLDIDNARDVVFNDDLPTDSAFRRGAVLDYYGNLQGTEAVGWQRHNWAARELRKLAIFSRPWLLIYLAVGCYLLTLFPGCYQVGLELSRVRWFYICFFGSILLFSAIFVGLGQVGGNERSRLRSIGVARELAQGVFDVSQWTVACVRDGGDYTITLPGSGAAVSGLDEMETVDGSFDYDANQLTMEMAPASTLGLFHRHRVTTTLQRPELAQLERAGRAIQSVQIHPGSELGKGAMAAWIVLGDIAYPLDISGTNWKLNRQSRGIGVMGMITLADVNAVQRFTPWGTATSRDVEEREAEQAIMHRVRPLLFAAAFQQTSSLDARLTRVPAGHARLLIQSSLPAGFRVTDAEFPDQRGALMFIFDYPTGSE